MLSRKILVALPLLIALLLGGCATTTPSTRPPPVEYAK
jgi:uncharacterized protein YceK